ncbi:hypothetical protein B7494_g629 [Chlorociboria aeruginascens]|nr:hypothetical protein B7494_g629 [Chlorociboria aeruginascens]
MADVKSIWDESYNDLGDDIETDLFETKDRNAPDHGEVKSFKPFKTKDGGLVYWSDNPSGFTISVERLYKSMARMIPNSSG